MDNSPRFDFRYPAPLAAVDFNSYLALECEILGEFARRLGYEEDQARWTERHAQLCRLINQYLWSEKDGDPAIIVAPTKATRRSLRVRGFSR